MYEFKNVLHFFESDLLEADEKFIAHGCNAMGVMGSGVALAIRNAWPEGVSCYFDASEKRNGEDLPMGHIYFGETNDGHTLINAITQRRTGNDGRRYVSYDAIDKSMRLGAQLAKNHGRTSIAIPKIGAGLGGGDWTVICAILDKVGEDYGVQFHVYIPDKNPAEG